jgi:hypothetical protein
MDPKHLAIAHGEKVVVLLIAGACAWMVAGAFTNDAIRPKGVTSQTIDEHINAIDQRMQSKDVPTLKPAPPYLEAMKTRFAKPVPSPTRMSWLMSHTDIAGIGKGIYFYIYELDQPSVTARDNIGTIEFQVTLPRAMGGGERHSGEPDKQWVRNTERTIVNTAKLVGVQIELQIGQGQFRPFKGKEVLDGGFVPIETLRKNNGKFTFPTESVWQRHTFHVRSVLKATGFTNEAGETSDATVLVHDAHEKPFEEPKDWTQLYTDWTADAEGFMAQFMAPEQGLQIPGVQLAKNELIYVSDWNSPPDASIQATADVRFAFEKSSVDPADPSKEVATFLLSKQFKGKGGAGNAWLDKPEVFKPAKGDILGGPRVVLIPGAELKREVDLSTPFQLDEIKHDIDRIWYYELEIKPRASGGKDKDLSLRPKTVKTDVAVLKNTKTGATIEMTKLADVRRPVKAGAIYYPLYPSEVYEEDKEFQKSPAEFQQWGLIPPEPLKHPPGQGPLQDLLMKTEDTIYKTDTDYYEFPDGRIYWWEAINHQLMHYPPTAEDGKPKPAPKAKPPTGKAPPAGRTPTPKAPPAGHAPPPPPNGQPPPPPPGSPGYPGQSGGNGIPQGGGPQGHHQ